MANPDIEHVQRREILERNISGMAERERDRPAVDNNFWQGIAVAFFLMFCMTMAAVFVLAYKLHHGCG